MEGLEFIRWAWPWAMEPESATGTRCLPASTDRMSVEDRPR